MNFWLALIISVITGLYFGKRLKPKGKNFSWLWFFIAMFLLLGGINLIFGIAFGALFVIRALFYIAAVILAFLMARWLYRKSKAQGHVTPTPDEQPKEEPPLTSPHEPPQS